MIDQGGVGYWSGRWSAYAEEGDLGLANRLCSVRGEPGHRAHREEKEEPWGGVQPRGEKKRGMLGFGGLRGCVRPELWPREAVHWFWVLGGLRSKGGAQIWGVLLLGSGDLLCNGGGGKW